MQVFCLFLERITIPHILDLAIMFLFIYFIYFFLFFFFIFLYFIFFFIIFFFLKRILRFHILAPVIPFPFP